MGNLITITSGWTSADEFPIFSRFGPKDYKEHVRKSAVIYIVDNVKIYVRKYHGGERGRNIHLECPCCDNVETHNNLGK